MNRGRSRGGRGGRGFPVQREGPGRHDVASNVSRMGSSRKGAKVWDDDDVDDALDYEELYFEHNEDDDLDFDVKSDSRSRYSKNAPIPTKRKVEMQILHMSEESQRRVEDALHELHGGKYQLPHESAYKDSGNRLDRRFWVRDRQLQVRGMEQQGTDPEGDADMTQALKLEYVSKFGVTKLDQCGFHLSRSTRALQQAEGDLGLALENLLQDFLNLQDDDRPDEQHSSEDIQLWEEMMNEEKMVLESIYGESFVEKIPDKVWEIKLELPGLANYLHKQEMIPHNKKELTRLAKDVCRFYLNGYCKFGLHCHKRHVQPEQVRKVEDKHLQKAQEENISFLEIRFRPGKVYPRDPPLVSFRTSLDNFPKYACLNLTKRLFEEATTLAADHAPSVFSMVSLLENYDTIEEAVRAEAPAYSLDEKRDLTSPVESNGDNGNELPSGAKSHESSTEVVKAPSKAERQRERRKMLDENQRLKKRYANRTANPDLMEARKSLPAWAERSRIVQTVNDNQVTVISGMTGCGKSTQVPQYIIDDWLGRPNEDFAHCNLICTQPRRISAIGVAERVAQERGEKVGSLTGYQIRLETKASSSTRLLFCTTGILLRRLESDPSLENVTHVIVDEVHERSEESDFLLMILRRVLKQRRELKLLLMSATLNADLFSRYFGDVPIIDIPGKTFPVEQIFLEDVIRMTRYVVDEGSSFARHVKGSRGQQGSTLLRKEQFKGGTMRDVFVDDFEIELDLSGDKDFKPARDGLRDEQISTKQIYHRYGAFDEAVCRALALMDFEKINYDLVEATLVFIADGEHEYPKSGSILVFLPGMQEIMTLYDQIVNHPVLGTKAGRFEIIPLHSSLSNEEQAKVFAKPKTENARKVVLSTNLAETSITIDDCVFVVDIGLMKEKRFDDAKNMESLDTVWVSKANAMQRKGRAGRVMPGVAFHLYTRFRFDHHVRSDPLPEVKRVPLEQMLLRIKVQDLFQGLSVQVVLSELIEPPEKSSVEGAAKRLQDVGAMNACSELTPLGRHLATLPVDVRIGKLLLFGSIFRCLDATLTIAACLSYRTPFVAPFGKQDEAKKKRLTFALRNSDHLAMLAAFEGWRKASERSQFAGYNFAQENFLSQKTLQTLVSMKHQFLELLSSIGFAPKGITLRHLSRRRPGQDGTIQASGHDFNVNASNHKLVVSVLCAALYPNVVQVLTPELKYKQTAAGAVTKPPTAQDLKFKTKSDGYVHIHPSSVNHVVARYENPYLVYHERIKTSRVFIRELSMVPVYPMILFGGGLQDIRVDLHHGRFVLSLDEGWMKFVTATHKVAELLKEMRLELDHILEEKISSPSLDLMTYPRGRLVINTIVNLITIE